MIRLLKGEIAEVIEIHKIGKKGVSKRNLLITRDQKIITKLGVEDEGEEGEVTLTTTIETITTTQTIATIIATNRTSKKNIETTITSRTTRLTKSKKIGTGIIMVINTAREASSAEEIEDSPVAIFRTTMEMEASKKVSVGVHLGLKRIIMKFLMSLKIDKITGMRIVPTIERLSRTHNQSQSRPNPNMSQHSNKKSLKLSQGGKNAGLRFPCTFSKKSSHMVSGR